MAKKSQQRAISNRKSRQQGRGVAHEAAKSPKSSESTIAVIGDAWQTTFAYYTPTSLILHADEQRSAIPQFKETSIDFTLTDGVFVTASVLQSILEAGTQKVLVWDLCFSSKINRLIHIVRKTSAAGDCRNQISDVRYLRHFSRDNQDPAFTGLVDDEHIWSPGASSDREAKLARKAYAEHYHQAAVIVDDGGGWKHNPQPRELRLAPRAPAFFILGCGLPTKEELKLPVWTQYSRSNHPVFAVVSATLLRHYRANIRRRLSWEATIEDLIEELDAPSELSDLRNMCSLIVRFGMSCAVYIPQGKAILHAIFDPLLGYSSQRNEETDGIVLGKSGILASAVLAELLRPSAEPHAAVISGAKRGLSLMRERLHRGYMEGISGSSVNNFDGLLDEEISHEMKAKHFIFGKPLSSSNLLASTAFGVFTTEIDTSKTLSILDATLTHQTGSGTSLVNLAEAIVFAGYEKVVNIQGHCHAVKRILDRSRFGDEGKDLQMGEVSRQGKLASLGNHGKSCEPLTIALPVLRCHDYVVVDRQEIECIRAVRNMFESYVNSGRDMPLSIAIFGQPGSGKSFAVKSLAKDLCQRHPRGLLKLPFFEFNLSQLQSQSDLEDIANVIREQNIVGGVPIVFIDEFDCALESREYGWLQYFLSPMHDGMFSFRGKSAKVGRAIFCFAGGTCGSFRAFAEKSRGADSEKFIAAKGPDFVSRLRGHINILSLSPQAAEKPILRRAVLLRSLLERLGRIEETSDGLKRALIDEDVAFALLTIDRFHHEARSMQAIVEMCVPFHGRIAKISLPSDDQLAMHVDPEEFHLRLERSRLRPSAWN